MVTDRRRQFFLRQAQQERHHAKVFNRVVLFMTPRAVTTVPLGLQTYRSRLDHACRRNDIVETLLGQQVVLEGFGELILHRMDRKFEQHRIGFKRIRTVLLAQEQGHQAFGHRLLHNLVQTGEVQWERVHELTSDYLALIDCILDELQPVFDVVGADSKWYQDTLRKRVTNWTESLL